MRIARLELSNWMIFKSVALDLSGGAIAVVGQYAGDVQRSNWSGKTSLLESIEWALYGVHRKRYEDGVIHDGESHCRVTVTLTGDVQVCRSRRSGKSTLLKVSVGDAEWNGKEAQTRVIELLGMDHADFRATLCIAQDDTLAIVSRTSGERRKLIAQWLELDAWQRAHARVVAHRAATRKRLETIRMSRGSLYTRVAGYVDMSNQLDLARVDVSVAKSDLAKAEHDVAGLAELHRAWESKLRLTDVSARAVELRDWIRSNSSVDFDVSSVRERAAVVKSVRLRVRDELSRVEPITRGEFDGECPLICAACPSADFVRESRDDAVSRCSELRDESARMDREARELQASEREHTTRERELMRVRAQYNSLVEEARGLRKLAEGAPDGAPDMDSAQSRLKAARGRWEAATRDAEKVSAEIALMEADGLRLNELEASISEIEAGLRLENIAVNALAPSGVPADIARDSLDDLEDRANALLQACGLSFSFGWDREARGLADSCSDCGYPYRGQRDKSCPSCGARRPAKMASELEILVNDGSGVVEDVRFKSGGAQVLVASAIRLSAGAMLRELRGSTIAFALVDEPFGALDARNRSELAMTFAAMLDMVGLEQAFVVSHDVALLDALPHGVEVVRDGACSNARMRQ